MFTPYYPMQRILYLLHARKLRYPYVMPHRVERMRIVYPTGEDLYVGNNHAYSYRDMMTVVQDMTVVNGKRMIYQFNDFGNVVSVRDELGYASYSKFSEALLPNHPEQVSKLQRSVVNLLPNHDFELSGYWSNVCYYNGQATFTYDTAEKYMGTLNPFRYRGYVYDEGSNMYVSPTNRKNRTNYN